MENNDKNKKETVQKSVHDKKRIEAKAKRLNDLIIDKKITKVALSQKAHMSRSHLYNLLNGISEIDDNYANALSEVLNVRPDYLLCKTNDKYPIHTDIGFTHTEYNASDYALLSFLSFHHKIIFCIENCNPDDNKERKISTNNIHSINFSKPTCIYSEDKNGLDDRRTSAVIKAVIIDGQRIKYGDFLFIIKEIQRYIDYEINNIKEIVDSYKQTVKDIETLSMDIQRNKSLYKIPEYNEFYDTVQEIL